MITWRGEGGRVKVCGWGVVNGVSIGIRLGNAEGLVSNGGALFLSSFGFFFFSFFFEVTNWRT